MKSIEIEDDLYQFIASQTKHIGESASDILRRLLMPESPAPVLASTPAPAAKPLASTQGTVFAILDESLLNAQKSRVERFLLVLSALYQTHSENFAAVLELRGKSRVYFAQDKEALLATGISTNPKQVPNSSYWVVTNNSTAKKVAMLGEVASVLGYSQQDSDQLAALFAPELFEE